MGYAIAGHCRMKKSRIKKTICKGRDLTVQSTAINDLDNN